MGGRCAAGVKLIGSELQVSSEVWLWRGQGKPRKEVWRTVQEVLNESRCSSGLVTSSSGSPFASEFTECVDKAEKVWDQRAFLGVCFYCKMREPKFVTWKPLFLIWNQKRMRYEKDERTWSVSVGSRRSLESRQSCSEQPSQSCGDQLHPNMAIGWPMGKHEKNAHTG